jgi:hypothetical protein
LANLRQILISSTNASTLKTAYTHSSSFSFVSFLLGPEGPESLGLELSPGEGDLIEEEEEEEEEGEGKEGGLAGSPPLLDGGLLESPEER